MVGAATLEVELRRVGSQGIVGIGKYSIRADLLDNVPPPNSLLVRPLETRAIKVPTYGDQGRTE